MNSIWLSLLWKEWREYRWKMLALTGILLVSLFVLSALAIREATYNDDWIIQDAITQMQSGLFLSYGFLASFFLAMGVAAKENGRGTATFLHSLPAPSWKPALVKLLLASLTAVLPILVTAILSYSYFRCRYFAVEEYEYLFLPKFSEYYGDRETTIILIRSVASAILSTLSLLWWASAMGVNRSDEVRAGATSFLIVLSIWLAAIWFGNISFRFDLHLENAILWLLRAGPGGPYFLNDFSSPNELEDFPSVTAYLSPLLILGQLGVVALFLYRFGKWQAARTDKGPVIIDSLPSTVSPKSPFKTQFAAIVWKQLQETGPLALFGLAGAIGLTAGGYWIDQCRVVPIQYVFMIVTASLTFLVTMVAGIGLFMEELQPGIIDFWRSRPLNLKTWFATKYFTGFVVLVVCLGIPALLAGVTMLRKWDDLNSPDVWVTGAFLAWMYIMVYSLTMLFQCLLRQPIYAVVLALGVLLLGIFAAQLVFEGWRGYSWIPLVAASMLVVWAAVVALTWKAIRHNWGWRA